MSIEEILLVTTGVLACSCAATFAMRITNSRLLGLGRLSAAFAVGALGAALLCATDWLPPLLSTAVPDFLVLLSFALLHLAVVDLVGIGVSFRLPCLLLGVQAVSDLVTLHYGLSPRFRLSLAALLLSVQTGQTAYVLLRKMRKGTRPASYFSTMLLSVLTLFQAVRSLAVAFKWIQDYSTLHRLQTVAFVVYLAFSLAIGFGTFWMATSTLLMELDDLASTDPLTRLYNRRVFLKWCDRIHARSLETHDKFSVLIADLDHFKSINDQFGHAIGDKVLCTAVERMQDAVRGIDILGRWGGEEFVALLPGASDEAAMLVAQRVRRNVERSLVSVTGQQTGEQTEGVRVTLSIGVATFQGTEDSVALMMKRADRALYAAKASGRNQVSVDGLHVPDFFSVRHARTGTQ